MLTGIGIKKPKPKEEEPKFEIVEPKEDPMDAAVEQMHSDGSDQALEIDMTDMEPEDTDKPSVTERETVVLSEGTETRPSEIRSNKTGTEQGETLGHREGSQVSMEPDRSEEEDIDEVVAEITSEDEQWATFLADDFVRDAYEATLKAITDKQGNNHKNAITERVMKLSMNKGSMVYDCLDYGIWSGDLEMPRTNYYVKVERPVKEGVPTWGDKQTNKVAATKKKGGFKTKPDPETCAQCGVQKGKKHKKDCLTWITDGGEAKEDVTKTEGMKKLIDKVNNGMVDPEEFAQSLMAAYAGAKNAISGQKILIPEWSAVSEEGQNLFIKLSELLFAEYNIRRR
jgi:hypothetical protein